MPKIVDHDAYRDEILEKCFKIFATHGYHKTTMRHIAKEVGVSTGTLYHYFPNKLALIKGVFDLIMRTNIGDALNRVKDVTSMDKRLAIAAEFWKEYGEYYKNVMLLAVDLIRNTDKNESEPIFYAFSEYYKQAMIRIFEISYDFSEILYTFFLGAVFHMIITPNRFSYDHAVDKIVNLIKKEKGLLDKQEDK